MTIQETTKILTMLSGFYGNGKVNEKIMAAAWHELLEPYEYGQVRQAVLRYAENDTREYAAFPAPGSIIKLADKERKELVEKARRIIQFASQRFTSVEGLKSSFGVEISEEYFKKLKTLPASEFDTESYILASRIQHTTVIDGRRYLDDNSNS